MNNQIGQTDKQEWNVAKYVHHIFCIRHKHHSLPLGPIQPSSHYTKELHELPLYFCHGQKLIELWNRTKNLSVN